MVLVRKYCVVAQIVFSIFISPGLKANGLAKNTNRLCLSVFCLLNQLMDSSYKLSCNQGVFSVRWALWDLMILWFNLNMLDRWSFLNCSESICLAKNHHTTCFNSYKLRFLFYEKSRQTVQIQIRHHIMQHLIRISTFCYKIVLFKLE